MFRRIRRLAIKQYTVIVAGVAVCMMMIISCNSTYTPKRKGYFKIDFPKHEYQVFDQPGYPYTFEYPRYAEIIKDTSFFEDKPENPYWINISFPRFNGRIYISYKEIGKNDFNKLVNDAYNLTYKHTTKATEINDSVMHTPNNVSGVFFFRRRQCGYRQTILRDRFVETFPARRPVFRCQSQ